MINVSLVKTRLRAARRGEVPSPVGIRQPNPYENVRIFSEFAIYQTHVMAVEVGLHLCFTLPAGGYATVVLEELINHLAD